VLRVNIHEAEIEFDASDPEGYRAGMNNVGKAAGGTENNVKLFEIPSGESLCPYHYEYVEEWLLVLEGELMVRTPDGEEEARRGDLICFPAGANGAHKLTNHGEQAVRAIMFSSSAEPSVAVYPDSDKIGVWSGPERLMVRRGDASVDYYDGETG
jgi:uncharacterized cupin superfamily protein